MTKKSATPRVDQARRSDKRRRRAARAAKAAGAAAIGAGVLLHGGQAPAPVDAPLATAVRTIAVTAPLDEPGDGESPAGSGSTQEQSDGHGSTPDQKGGDDGGSGKDEPAESETTASPSTSEQAESQEPTQPREQAEPQRPTEPTEPRRPTGQADSTARPRTTATSNSRTPSRDAGAEHTRSSPGNSSATTPPDARVAGSRQAGSAASPAATTTASVTTGTTSMPRDAARQVAADLTAVATTVRAATAPVHDLAPASRVTRAVGQNLVTRIALALAGVTSGSASTPIAPVAPTSALLLAQWALFRRGENPLFNQSPTATSVADSATTGHLVTRDPDGDHLTYEVVQPQDGHVDIDADGRWTYAPGANPPSDGRVQFTIIVRDNDPDAPGLGRFTDVLREAVARTQPALADRLFGTHTTTVAIEVTVPTVDQPPPAPPVRTPAERGVVTGNLSYVDPARYTVEVVGQPARGTVTVDQAGNYTYVPSAAAQLAAARTPGKDYDTFTVIVQEKSTTPQLRGFRTLAAVPAQGGTSYEQQVEIRPAATPAPHVVGTIALGPQPSDLVLSPDGRRAVVTDNVDYTVRLIDMDTGTATVVHTGTQASDGRFTPDGSAIYILDGATDKVTVLDGTTGADRGEILVGSRPGAVTFGPDGSRAYVTSYGVDGNAASVTVIDTARHAAVGSPVPIAYPSSVVFSPDGSRAWVVGDDSIVTFGSDDEATHVATGSGTRPPVFSADGTVAYVSSGTTVTMIDTTSGLATGTVAAGSRPGDVRLSPDGTHGFVTSREDGTVTVFDTTSNTDSRTVTLGGSPRDVVFTPDGRFALVVRDTDGMVTVLDGDGERVGDDIPVGQYPGEVQFDPAGGHAWIADSAGDVTLVDLATGAAAGSVHLGGSATPLVFSPDGRRAYVNAYRDTGGGTFYILDASDGRTIDTVDLGANTRAPQISPDGTRVYLADRGSGVVTVVDTTTDEIRPAISATPGGGKRGFNARFTPDGRYAYFVTGGSGDERQVVFLSTVDDTATTLRAIGGRRPVFSSDHGRAYVIDSTGRLVVIDLGAGLADDAEQSPDGDDEASAA